MMRQMRSLLLLLVTTFTLHATMHLRCVADMNRDGTPDLIMQDDVTGKAEVRYLSYDPATSSWQVTHVDPITAGNSWQIVAAADFNGDGYPDLYSTDLALTDASGAAVTSPAGGVAFQASSSQDQHFTFTVTGQASHAQ
jgi:FG-GAP-like repeat